MEKAERLVLRHRSRLIRVDDIIGNGGDTRGGGRRGTKRTEGKKSGHGKENYMWSRSTTPEERASACAKSSRARRRGQLPGFRVATQPADDSLQRLSACATAARARRHIGKRARRVDRGRKRRLRMKRSEEHTSELQSQSNLVCRLLLEKKKKTDYT